MKVGRVCIKTMGREKGLPCMIIEEIDENFVMIDGLTRRRKCNKLHLTPQPQVLKITKKAGTEDVLKALKDAGIIAEKNVKSRLEKKDKPKGPKPVKKKKAPQPKKEKKKKAEPKKPKEKPGTKKKEAKKPAKTNKK